VTEGPGARGHDCLLLLPLLLPLLPLLPLWLRRIKLLPMQFNHSTTG
jgi:hypothetical protein